MHTTGSWPASGLPAGIHGLTTVRSQGSYGLGGTEAVGAVMDRWSLLKDALAQAGVRRLVAARQVHGSLISTHAGGWEGLLLQSGIDGHISLAPGTALAVTTADCTPVLIGHPRGAIAALHAGWRGVAAGILEAGLSQLSSLGFPEQECSVYLGPAICGNCYEVGPEVVKAVTGQVVTEKQTLDVRANLADRARQRRVASVTVDQACTRCQHGSFFSHRGGDSGRQLSIIWIGSP